MIIAHSTVACGRCCRFRSAPVGVIATGDVDPGDRSAVRPAPVPVALEQVERLAVARLAASSAPKRLGVGRRPVRAGDRVGPRPAQPRRPPSAAKTPASAICMATHRSAGSRFDELPERRHALFLAQDERSLDEGDLLHLAIGPLGHPKGQLPPRRVDECFVQQERAVGDDQTVALADHRLVDNERLAVAGKQDAAAIGLESPHAARTRRPRHPRPRPRGPRAWCRPWADSAPVSTANQSRSIAGLLGLRRQPCTQSAASTRFSSASARRSGSADSEIPSRTSCQYSAEASKSRTT